MEQANKLVLIKSPEKRKQKDSISSVGKSGQASARLVISKGWLVAMTNRLIAAPKFSKVGCNKINQKKTQKSKPGRINILKYLINTNQVKSSAAKRHRT